MAHGIYMSDVAEQLEHCTLIGLRETHSNKDIDISLQEYYTFRKDRREHKKAWVASGGVAVLIKTSLRQVCKFDPISDSDIIWEKIMKELLTIDSDLCLGFTYVPPVNSTYGKKSKIQNKLISFM